jgi:hypothetical protein
MRPLALQYLNTAIYILSGMGAAIFVFMYAFGLKERLFKWARPIVAIIAIVVAVLAIAQSVFTYVNRGQTAVFADNPDAGKVLTLDIVRPLPTLAVPSISGREHQLRAELVAPGNILGVETSCSGTDCASVKTLKMQRTGTKAVWVGVTQSQASATVTFNVRYEAPAKVCVKNCE